MVRCCIIGKSSSGKSSLLKLIEGTGITTIGEVAREVLTKYPNYSRQHQQVKMLNLQYEREELLKSTNTRFVSDRGLQDYFVFSQDIGLDIPFYREQLDHRYDLVFKLPNRHFKPDGTRVEIDDKQAQDLQDRIERLYMETGHTLIEVPDLDLVGRYKFILPFLEHAK
jgi:nicotinamide riboside kinase